MASKVFVGSLSWDTDEGGLRQAFARFGEITECRVISDRETGRSRGFGFVTFASPEHAQAAITEMDGQQLDGRNIRVNEAQERRPGGNGGGGPRRSFGGGGGGGGGGYGGGGRGGPRGDGGGRGPRGGGGGRRGDFGGGRGHDDDGGGERW